MTTMLLSDAIDCGAKIRPQAFDRYFEFTDGQCTGSCALGAAIECVTGDQHTLVLLSNLFPELDQPVMDPENTIPGEDTLFSSITYRNDILKWTREAIAAWVREKGY